MSNRGRRNAIRNIGLGLLAVGAAVAGLLTSPAQATAPADNSGIIARIIVKGKPYAVFSDQQGKYAYVVIHQDGYVDAIDVAKAKVAFTLSTGGYPNAVIARPKGKQVYVTQWGYGGSDDLLLFDIARRRKIASIKTCGDPDGAALTTDGALLYVACAGDSKLAVVDTAAGKSIREYATGDTPNNVALSRDGAHAYVTNFHANTISVIDTKANAVGATLPTCSEPLSLAVTPDNSRLYVSCIDDYEIWGFDTATKQVIAKFPAAVQPGGVAISPDGKKLYIAAKDITVIDIKTNATLGTIRVQGKRLWSIALSPDGTKAYATSWPNVVYIVSTAGVTGP